jgi:hypothetical protein
MGTHRLTAAAGALVAVAVVAAPLIGQAASRPATPAHVHPSRGGGSAQDEAAFHAMQQRGKVAMAVDQYTSTHRFDALPDGGRIELQRDVDHPEGVAQIRRQLREIQRAFTGGDFGTPAFVHMRDVPGARVMAAKRAVISYRYSDLPRGGELRIKSSDPQAVVAVHEFLAFQRQDHRAGS